MKPFKAGFLLGVVKESDFPDTPFPEVAFVGRSNVGKSSLINSIVLDGNLARTSSTPGKTQQINFYPVDSKWMFVDLPGFGYAQVSKADREHWNKLNYGYLTGRKQLQLVCILVDSRHDPQPVDLKNIELMENHQKEYVVVLTKTDKLTTTQNKERLEQLKGLVQYCKHCVDIIPYSAKSKTGRHELIGIIKRIMKMDTLDTEETENK